MTNEKCINLLLLVNIINAGGKIMKLNFEKNVGITLIALVVTIIVLLILARG